MRYKDGRPEKNSSTFSFLLRSFRKPLIWQKFRKSLEKKETPKEISEKIAKKKNDKPLAIHRKASRALEKKAPFTLNDFLVSSLKTRYRKC